MSSSEDELVAFLRARLDEDEQLARQALGEPALRQGRETRYPYPERLATALHDGRHRPARVIREVGAKRAIIMRYERAAGVPESVVSFVQGQDDGYRQACLDAIRDHAAVYSDHPDYRAPDDWKPLEVKP